ncbi:hypothetical protein GCM10009765_40240 [Fodinicola feengrottensis]|uniref:Uncharacterized protein n=1 Tax=Fodinicola feengrottensis TaxID=435914 RepID=A0ABN2HEQ2_9ACTN
MGICGPGPYEVGEMYACGPLKIASTRVVRRHRLPVLVRDAHVADQPGHDDVRGRLRCRRIDDDWQVRSQLSVLAGAVQSGERIVPYQPPQRLRIADGVLGSYIHGDSVLVRS